jgi:hypothetical protein
VPQPDQANQPQETAPDVVSGHGYTASAPISVQVGPADASTRRVWHSRVIPCR